MHHRLFYLISIYVHKSHECCLSLLSLPPPFLPSSLVSLSPSLPLIPSLPLPLPPSFIYLCQFVLLRPVVILCSVLSSSPLCSSNASLYLPGFFFFFLLAPLISIHTLQGNVNCQICTYCST